MGGHIDVIGYVPGQKNGWSYTCDRGIYQARRMGGRIHVIGVCSKPGEWVDVYTCLGYLPGQENGRSYTRDRGYVPSQENGWSYTRDRGMYQVRRMGGRMYVIRVCTKP
jgi:hypothetical protein